VIPIARPQMGEEEKDLVWSALSSGALAQGARVRELEERFAEFIGTPHAVATSSGTTALHLALLGYGIGPGDEVVTVPFTFIASANSIMYTGARPVFVDVQEATFNIDPDLVEAAITPKTRAIIPVDLSGLPVDRDRLYAIAAKHKLRVVEDAAQAILSNYKGRRPGAIGHLGCLSFHETKNVISGEGGALLVNDPALVARAVAIGRDRAVLAGLRRQVRERRGASGLFDMRAFAGDFTALVLSLAQRHRQGQPAAPIG